MRAVLFCEYLVLYLSDIPLLTRLPGRASVCIARKGNFMDGVWSSEKKKNP